MNEPFEFVRRPLDVTAMQWDGTEGGFEAIRQWARDELDEVAWVLDGKPERPDDTSKLEAMLKDLDGFQVDNRIAVLADEVDVAVSEVASEARARMLQGLAELEADSE